MTTLIDTSDRLPDGGYLLPAIPAEYLDSPVNEAKRLGAMDTRLDLVRAACAQILKDHDVRYAVGAALDRLGNAQGVPRLRNEDDGVYRARIPYTRANGSGATTHDTLYTYLTQITNGTPVVIYDGTTPGTFYVVFAGVPPQGQQIVSYILAAKALGTFPGIFIRNPMGALNRLGTFRLGTSTVGGGGYLTLLSLPIVGTSGNFDRVGVYRLGVRRIGA